MPDVPNNFDHAAAQLADTQAPGSRRVIATLAIDRGKSRVAVIWSNTSAGDSWLETVDLKDLCLYEPRSGVACRNLDKVRDECVRRCYFAIN